MSSTILFAAIEATWPSSAASYKSTSLVRDLEVEGVNNHFFKNQQ